MSAARMLDRSGRRGSGEEFERRREKRVKARDVREIREGCERRRKTRGRGGTEISILVRFEASNVVYAIDETERCNVHAEL
jgi:hypothetical protein